MAAKRPDEGGLAGASHAKLPPLPVNPDGSLRLMLREAPWPMTPRGAWQTQAQHEACLPAEREHRRNMSIWEGLMRLAMTRHGCHRRCRIKGCRRAGACVGIRPPKPEEHVLNFLPPCQPVDKDTLFFWRDAGRAILFEAFPHCAPPPRDAAVAPSTRQGEGQAGL